MTQKLKSREMIDWLVDTVVLALFPMIISVIASLCVYGSVDINRLIGDGELILSAFLITTPSLINCYRDESNKRHNKKLFYFLLFAAFCQLVAYTSIKIAQNRVVKVVYIASALCVLSSIIVSWQGEQYLNNKEDKQ